jgi:hypothetical protein
MSDRPDLLSLPIFPLVTDFLDIANSLTVLFRVSKSIRLQVLPTACSSTDLVIVLRYLVAKKPLYIVDEKWIESCRCGTVEDLVSVINHHLLILTPNIYARNPTLLYITLNKYYYSNGIVEMALDTLSSILAKSVDETCDTSHKSLLIRVTSDTLFPSAIIDCVQKYGFSELVRWEKVTSIFSQLIRPEVMKNANIKYVTHILNYSLLITQCYNHFKKALFCTENASTVSGFDTDRATRCLINAIKGLSNFFIPELLEVYARLRTNSTVIYAESIDLLSTIVTGTAELQELTSDLIISLVTLISNIYTSYQRNEVTQRLLSTLPGILFLYLVSSFRHDFGGRVSIRDALVRLLIRVGAFESHLINDRFTITERNQIYSHLLLLGDEVEPNAMLLTLSRIFVHQNVLL